jgi:hypothetical protein
VPIFITGIGAFVLFLYLRRSRESESIGEERETNESPEWQAESLGVFVSNVNALTTDHLIEFSD